MNIGVFDSGSGGLCFLHYAQDILPEHTFMYQNDTKNMPYGSKSLAEIYALTTKGITQLFGKGCTLVILACNTACTVLPSIQQNWLPKKYPHHTVLGIVRPTTEYIATLGIKNVHICATPTTTQARTYNKDFDRVYYNPITITYYPLPTLALWIEQKIDHIHILKQFEYAEAVTQICKSVPNTLPRLVLGCTHYEHIEYIFRSCLPNTQIISQGKIAANSLKSYLLKTQSHKM